MLQLRELPKFVLCCSYEAALRKGVTTVLNFEQSWNDNNDHAWKITDVYEEQLSAFNTDRPKTGAAKSKNTQEHAK